MRRIHSTTAVLLAMLVGACQAFTGTGDLEVRDGGPGATAASSGAGAEGGQGGAGGAGTTSVGSTATNGSQTASSSSGGGCVGCVELFKSNGTPSRTCSNDVQVAYDQLIACVCNSPDSSGCFHDNVPNSPCEAFCTNLGGGQAPGDPCETCAQTQCMAQAAKCVGSM